MNSLLQKWARHIATCTLVVGLLSFAFMPVHKAHAQFAVTDILSTIQNTFTALSSQSLEQKELVWDGLFYDIATQALQQMTSDMLDWVSSGFDGEPAFVTDLSEHLGKIGEEVAADFVYGDQFNNACKAIQLDARRAIAQAVQDESVEYNNFKERAACTIENIGGGNPEAFLSGEFSAGGWSMWFETVLHPQNTSVGLAILGKDAYTKEKQAQQAEEKTQLDWSDGWKSQEACTMVDGKRKCVTGTPGGLIRDQASLALQAPLLRMINADEMNEIIGSLFSNLAQQAVQGVNGLLGLGSNSLYANVSFGAEGDLSYLEAVRKEQGQNGDGGGNRIESALKTETQVLQLELGMVEELNDITELFLETREPHEDDSCWDLELPEVFEEKLDELVESVPTTVSTVVALEEMLENYEKATTPQAQLPILQQLSRMQSEGVLSGRTAVIEYEYYLRNELIPAVDDFKEDIEDQEDAC